MLIKSKFGEQSRRLLGKHIERVVYVELDIDPNFGNSWNRYPEFDSLNFGVDLYTRQGEVTGFIWGRENECWELTLTNGSITAGLAPGFREIEMTANKRWQEVVGNEIINISIYEDTVEADNSTVVSPQDCEITFSGNKSVLISTAKLDVDEGRMQYYADEIVVSFNAEIWRKYKMGPYGTNFSSQELEL